MKTAMKTLTAPTAKCVVILLICVAGSAWGQTRQEIQFPDILGYETLKCDFHMHTVFSDGTVWPTVRVDEAWAEGLDAISITDHIEFKSWDITVRAPEWRGQEIASGENAAYEIARNHFLGTGKGVLVVRGAELTRATPPGHFNILFLTDVNELNTKVQVYDPSMSGPRIESEEHAQQLREDFKEIFRAVERQGGYVFWNHPGWQGKEKGKWGPEQDWLYERGLLHGIEICNQGTYFREAFQYAVEKNLAVLGNTDVHEPILMNAPTVAAGHRVMTLVFAKAKTVEALREALFAGRTAVWWKDRLLGREEYLAAMFQACVEVGPGRWVRKTATAGTAAVEIHNRSEIDIQMQRVGPGTPGSFTLPAQRTSLARFPVSAEGDAEEMSYRVSNFLVGPDKPLKVKLKIPRPVPIGQ